MKAGAIALESRRERTPPAPNPQLMPSGVLGMLLFVFTECMLFAGLVFAAVYRLGMNSPRNFWFVLTAMTLGMLAVSVGLIPYLPALIALAVAVVAANWHEFKLTRKEAVSMAIVGLALLATLPLIWSILGPGKVRAPAHKPAQRTAAGQNRV